MVTPLQAFKRQHTPARTKPKAYQTPPVETRAVCIRCGDVYERATMVNDDWWWRCQDEHACNQRRAQTHAPCFVCGHFDDKRRMLTSRKDRVPGQRKRVKVALPQGSYLCWHQGACRRRREGTAEEPHRFGPQHDWLHQWTSQHRYVFGKTAFLACFYCCRQYAVGLVDRYPAWGRGTRNERPNWIDGGQTALCPFCGIDSVLPSVCGAPVDDVAFLKELERMWFGDHD